MAISLNLRFQASEECDGKDDPDGDYEHFRGEILMSKISDGLKKLAWKVSDIEFWRDLGWSVCSYDSERAKLEVILVPFLDKEFHREWVLQITPKNIPFFGRLLGQKPSATPSDVYQLACDIHSLLKKESSFEMPRWSWDGPPNDKIATPEPQPPESEN
ncbi:MAG: hypothetical protein WCT04_27210 [Planctomycetota bacterium]